jgi:indolepyruvate decarboxylase
MGIHTANLDSGKVICANSDRITVRRHNYVDVPLRSFTKALLKAPLMRRHGPPLPARAYPWGVPPRGDAPVTVAGLFRAVNDFLTEDMIVICDIGDSCFGAADLVMRGRTNFLSSAYYASMGFAMPAAVGSQFVDCRLRPVVLVGDGAFQMTGMELSTAAKYGLTPIVIVLNNHGYGTERQILDGPFNDIHLWDFAKVPQVLGRGKGFSVKTMGELRAALSESLDCRDCFCILDVDLDPYDISPALKRLGESMSKNLK